MLRDATPAGAQAGASLDARWRARAQEAQSSALPTGRVAVSCPAPFARGGLGRHLQEIDDALRRRGCESVCLCEPGAAAAAIAGCREVRPGALARARLALARHSHARRMQAASAGFDAAAARQLPDAEHLISFNGTSLAQFRAARGAGFQSLSLIAANPHMRRVLAQHELAHRRHPIEPPWATRLLARNLREYALADRIYVSSRYSWESFVDAGTPQEALALFPLTPDARFTPRQAPPASDTFQIVYVGALTVHKGVPLLVEAIRRLDFADLRLVLVGGWKTRGMRRYLEAATAADERISVSPGDPLPRLRAASLYVHPAYEDGFAYAPAEALSSGVPVLVSADTGMKELIASERDGLVLPTGSLGALTEAIAGAYRRELFGA
jgi:glycosyltransferase involved in cell wall biosynthesis